MSRLKDLFKKTAYIPIGREDGGLRERNTGKKEGPSVPDGLFIKCPKCGEMVYKEDVKEHSYVCPKCEGYFRIKTKTRLRMILDEGSFEEWGADIGDRNALDFPGYEEKLDAVREKTHIREAVTIGKGKIQGQDVVFGVCDARFFMSSMGYVVGERITRAFERATREKLPVILYCCSGGARMQEGIISLMQMAKTSQAIKRHKEAGLFYAPVLTDPTTGGVTASFAMLGDIILAEPGALIGFAGPRVIAQTIGEKLPEGFQRAEFLVEKGIIDGIVKREKQKEVLAKLLKIHATREGYGNFVERENGEDLLEEEAFEQDKTPWERVEISRMAERPAALSYIQEIFDEFIELHGDRAFRDDGAIVGGIALLDGQPVTVIGQQKGKNIKENKVRNFGMASPEGYRKALRLMQEAEKFRRPVITFVDTPGAACGIGAEERGQGEAIARNLCEMSGLTVPILTIVIGEGGSGGALGLAVANEVWMLENATYSILSPEGFASILWKDGKRAKEAAGVMGITAGDLKRLHVVEQVIPENGIATMENLPQIARDIKGRMKQFLTEQSSLTPEEIRENRYQRFRRM